MRGYLESKTAGGIAADGVGRCLLSQKGSIPANVALEIDDPRCAGLASEMPDDLRALALEGLQAPYEGDTEYGAESPTLLEDLTPPANDRRSFSTLELSEEQAEAIKNAKMDPRHDHLNALLEEDFGRRLLAQKRFDSSGRRSGDITTFRKMAIATRPLAVSRSEPHYERETYRACAGPALQRMAAAKDPMNNFRRIDFLCKIRPSSWPAYNHIA